MKNRFNYDELNPTGTLVLAFIIILSHIIMLLLIALLILFVGFITKHLIWIILLLGFFAICAVLYMVFFLKRHRKGIGELLTIPEMRGKVVEVRLLGGLASLKVSDEGREPASLIECSGPAEKKYLESPELSRARELAELARLLEEDLITREEYQKAKNEMFSR
jgi:hypothetical protein